MLFVVVMVLSVMLPLYLPHPSNKFENSRNEAAAMIKPIYPNLRDTLAGVNAFIHDINTIFVSIFAGPYILRTAILTLLSPLQRI